ncbi:MAG: hypothetical protein HY558_02630 [Euryarchaeota archaeon]|nr:hypothetical protein [Euryarchaeota archaeon]
MAKISPRLVPVLVLESVPPPPPRERISVTQRLYEMLQGGLIRIWIENFLKGCGCCLGAWMAFLIVAIMAGLTSGLWGPIVQENMRSALPIPGFELPLALAALAMVFALRAKTGKEP